MGSVIVLVKTTVEWFSCHIVFEKIIAGSFYIWKSFGNCRLLDKTLPMALMPLAMSSSSLYLMCHSENWKVLYLAYISLHFPLRFICISFTWEYQSKWVDNLFFFFFWKMWEDILWQIYLYSNHQIYWFCRFVAKT